MAFLAVMAFIAQKNEKLPHGSFSLNNKPIIITFLAMEKVILLCTIKTRPAWNGSAAMKFF
jgi:hypothetical protein